MNSELINMIQLTLAAKQYLQTGQTDQSLIQNTAVEGYDFRFASHEFGGSFPAAEASSCEQWITMLKERGARDLKFMMIDEIDDFSRLSRPNGLPCFLICFYDGGATSWNKRWLYNPATQKWRVQLFETVAQNAPHEKPRFNDVSQDMVALLERLRVLAQKLQLSDLAFQFRVAQKSLQANFVNADKMMQPSHRRLLGAAIDAYVFDGENSWLEKGKAAADAKGLTDEYDELTKLLYRGIALSCMYAANEW